MNAPNKNPASVAARVPAAATPSLLEAARRIIAITVALSERD
ncbi:MAG: hypothetical protein WA210_16300 [Burkholderiaceae bacterium]